MSDITKKAISASLEKILCEKKLSNITVQDIADDCGISRQAVVATVVSVERCGKVIDKKHPLWRFYKIVFVNPPVRRVFHSLHKLRKA